MGFQKEIKAVSSTSPKKSYIVRRKLCPIQVWITPRNEEHVFLQQKLLVTTKVERNLDNFSMLSALENFKAKQK